MYSGKVFLSGVIAGVGMLTLSAAAQDSKPLPAAPSAVLEQQQQPPQPTPAAAPKATTPPASQGSPSDTKPAVPADTNETNAPAKAEELKPPSNPRSSESPAPETPEKSEETIRVPVNEVNLIFTATDKHGRFVKNLKEQEIRVVDDHKAVDKFRSFSNQTDLPLRVGLLIDTSNSIRDRFQFEQQAAIEFLSQIMRPKADQAFVLGFDTVAEVTQDFTNNTEKLSSGVRMLRPGGGTALFDALYQASRDKLMKNSAGQAVRRAIILVSDGNDNQSRVTREQAIEMAQRAEVIVYTISTNTSGMIERGDRILQRIADESGGRAFFPLKLQEVSDAFSEIQEELRSQYAVAYKPPDFKADGSYRPIEITAADRKLHIRARKGYFAPLQP
ncbi:MAG TPA: VWA domain-containing protein [Terriglobales bacterium]|nr:VWA domain-containing protein [Terriglobales bacterium]